MKKSLSKALLITVSVSTLVHASENIVSTKDVNNFKLDEEKITNYQIKEATDSSTTSQSDPQEKVEINQEYPKIIEEKTATGKIEKLVDENGHILAQKTIENDKVIQKVLNYYHPNGKLSRQITADENEGYYAEEFYSNGKLASQAGFLSEGNKIGKEKLSICVNETVFCNDADLFIIVCKTCHIVFGYAVCEIKLCSDRFTLIHGKAL